MKLCAYDIHDITSRSWLVKDQGVHTMFTAEGDLAVLQMPCCIFIFFFAKDINAM
jgi:hypothetical protein